jgi:hypothetical protein
MTVPPKSKSGTKEPVQGESVVNDFVGVMGKLKAIIEEENDFLSRGLPATLLDTTERKGALSDEYASLGNELVDGAGSTQIISNPELHAKLLEASKQLFALTEENRQLLSEALAATRRRVDLVMDAVRASETEQPQAPNLSVFKRR